MQAAWYPASGPQEPLAQIVPKVCGVSWFPQQNEAQGRKEAYLPSPVLGIVSAQGLMLTSGPLGQGPEGLHSSGSGDCGYSAGAPCTHHLQDAKGKCQTGRWCWFDAAFSALCRCRNPPRHKTDPGGMRGARRRNAASRDQTGRVLTSVGGDGQALPEGHARPGQHKLRDSVA